MKDRPREVVLEELRQKASLLPGTNVTIGQPISHRIDHMLSGTRANIAVKIFGDDLQILRQLATQVQAQMAQVPGVVDLSAEAQADIPTLKVRVDPAAAARQGLETGAVAEALQTARVGHTVGQVLEGQIAFPLVVRYALDDSTDLQCCRDDTDPDAGPPADSVVRRRDDSAGSRPELRDARERPAPDGGPEQRHGTRSAERRQRHSGSSRRRTSRCLRGTTSSTAGSSRARRRRHGSSSGCRLG